VQIDIIETIYKRLYCKYLKTKCQGKCSDLKEMSDTENGRSNIIRNSLNIVMIVEESGWRWEKHDTQSVCWEISWKV